MRYISLFAGIGGFDLALNRLGHVCVWASEWDKYAAQIYNRKFWNKYQATGEAPHTEGTSTNASSNNVERTSQGIDTRDIRTVPTSEIPDHDLLVGGFPCQAFSIAGKRKGFDDTRGTLFFEIARILADKRPRYFILENVKGLLSHDNGKTFSTILGVLTDLGYDFEWQVLNSKNFGVPQNRERVFIVGNIRGQPRPEVFPIRQDDNPLITKGGERASSTVISRTLTATDAKMHLDGNYIKQLNNPVHSNNRVYSDVGISPALNTAQGGNRQPKIAVPMRWVRTEKGKEYRREAQKQGRDLTPFNDGYRELIEAEEDVSGCITNTLQKDALLKQDTRIRRLTPTECERLQGFPDGWTEGLSDTQRYKCLGNAVTVNVVYEVAKRLSNASI